MFAAKYAVQYGGDHGCADHQEDHQVKPLKAL
jgi:hypothetical protein